MLGIPKSKAGKKGDIFPKISYHMSHCHTNVTSSLIFAKFWKENFRCQIDSDFRPKKSFLTSFWMNRYETFIFSFSVKSKSLNR